MCARAAAHTRGSSPARGPLSAFCSRDRDNGSLGVYLRIVQCIPSFTSGLSPLALSPSRLSRIFSRSPRSVDPTARHNQAIGMQNNLLIVLYLLLVAAACAFHWRSPLSKIPLPESVLRDFFFINIPRWQLIRSRTNVCRYVRILIKFS